MLAQPNFSQRVLADHHIDALVEDCVALVDHRIDQQALFRRLVFKAGIAFLNAIKEGAIRHIVVDMLPAFADALEPLDQRFQQTGATQFSEFLLQHSGEVTTALLSVTDARVENYGHAAVSRLYESLRDSAEQELSLALPQLSRILETYASTGARP